VTLRLCQPSERAPIEAFLRADLDLHLYELGDLDPFFWPRTRWVGAEREGLLAALAMVYQDPAGHETLLLLERHDPSAAAYLLQEGQALLPQRFYSHLSPGLAELLPGARQARGLYRKMSLEGEVRFSPEEPSRSPGRVVSLGPQDQPEVEAFYAEAYPGNWFEATMLETGCYRGWRGPEGLQSVSGVHVYAPGLGVAALGNIATAPEARGRGLARRVTGSLCRDLQGQGIRVGLNVAAENAAAIACYEGLGFRIAADYEEWAFG
jgi:RimJ/RimL family protein N-acetyltransferase